MRINEKILSIPPYISTAWKNIASLSEKEGTLVINLKSGTNISIPALPAKTLEEIFTAHEKFLEHEVGEPTSGSDMSFGIPFSAEGSPGMPFGTMMQHDSAQKNAPPIPDNAIDKIKHIATAMGMDEMMEQMPKAEPHCNCPYCQIARAIHGESAQEKDEGEEDIVTDDDLHFRDWEIEEIKDKLFRVKHPLNANEQYQVFLGTPVGCTCGQKDCEHIKAVLRN